MTDSPAAGATLDDPFASLTGALAATTRMQLEVVSSRRVTPHMQELVLTAPELAGFTCQPGQDLMLMVAVNGNRPVRRRYTIRALDTGSRLITLNVVRHGGGGPGEEWVASAGPGERIEGIGPRGKVFVSGQAPWRLFAGDESALPAFFTMASALPPGERALVILEIPEAADEQELVTAGPAEVTWLHRDGRAAGEAAALVAAVTAAALPDGPGHVYLAGEGQVVLALREALAARGVQPGQVSPKAYWGRGRANAAHGEPAKEA